MGEMTLEEAPRKAREHFEKGVAALERGNFDYAMDMFDMALDLAPRLLKARKYLRAAAVRKHKEGKSGAFSRVMGTVSGSLAIMQAQGQLKKKPEQALKTSEQLLRKDPLNMTFIKLNADAAMAAGMPEAAVLTLEVAKEHYPTDAELLERLARLYQDVDRMHDARLLYEDLARLKPGDQKVIKALKDATALDTMQRGGWNEATSYRDMIKDSKEATLLEQQNKAVKSDRDVDALIAETLAKIQREPQNINYRRALAELYGRDGQFDAAISVLREAQAASGGGDPQIDRQLSTVQVKKFDQRIAAIEAAGDQAGLAALQQEKAQFLLSDAEERVRRYPNDLQFKYEYGVLLYEHGRFNEAIQLFQQAFRNPQRRIRSMYYMALCFKAKQQFDLAADQLAKAAAELQIMDETKKDILYELGTVCEATGQVDRAVEHFKEIYSVDIGYRDVSQKIEKYYKK
jgi:tetratricopeptide (TPR) repeat protein